MSAFLELPPITRAAGTVVLPGSKSISNRTLLLAALASGATQVRGLLDSDDVRHMLEALKILGVNWTRHPGTNDYRIQGVAGRFPVRAAKLFLGNAGTAFRPLCAVLALQDGRYELSGVARMHERPIGDLVDALRQLGARIEYLGNTGFPPLAIEPPVPGAAGAATVSVRGNVSSQFLTALLMAAPLRPADTTIQVIGELISKPYIARRA
jgi:3-phosphoshikimate 1-carboxyvinyltransferase